MTVTRCESCGAPVEADTHIDTGRADCTLPDELTMLNTPWTARQ